MDTHMKAKELAERPYIVVTTFDTTTEDDPIYFSRVFEFEGCFGQGKTREAAIKDLHLAMVDFIESLLDDGLPVPEPTQSTDSTLGAAAHATFTFTNEGRKLLAKKTENYRDVFVLTA